MIPLLFPCICGCSKEAHGHIFGSKKILCMGCISNEENKFNIAHSYYPDNLKYLEWKFLYNKFVKEV